jgi:hypothetical protein
MRLVMTRAALATVLLGLPALAGPVGYAQATGYYKKDTRPTLYQPLNLLDGRDATAWCTTGSDPLNDTLVFGFKGSARIEEVRITTGNNFDGNTFKEFARAHKFELKGLRDGRKFTVADQRGVQAVPLSPPLEASRVTLEVLDVYPSDDPEASVCITDVVFISDGKPLNGPWMAPKLKYDKSMQPLLGTWFAGYEGAPDRFLNFFYDGTYRYSFEPFDQGRDKPKELTGTYDATPTRLTLEIPGKGKVNLKVSLDKAKGDKGFTLTMEGDLPPELKGAFRSKP